MPLSRNCSWDAMLRKKLLPLFSYLPDAWAVRIQYRLKTGRRLDLKAPRRYTEKLQWYKLHYRMPLLTQCADKYAVREYVRSKGLGFLLNELYAVYERAEDIDFDSLPDCYAMKANNGTGTNRFVHSNAHADHAQLRATAAKWLRPARSPSGEWVYENIVPRVIFEKLLPMDQHNDLPDYKFYCFNGEPFCLYTVIDRFADGNTKGKMGFFDLEFNRLPGHSMAFAPLDRPLEKPKNFDKMVEYARILSQDFPHVRVDFYNIDGQIVFGELTFLSASGYTIFEPDEFDLILGEQFILPTTGRKSLLDQAYEAAYFLKRKLRK